MFCNVSWSTKSELEGNYDVKEQIKIWILNSITGAGVAVGFQKLTYKIRTFQAQPEITCSYKKVCNTVIVQVITIQIWTIWIIQIKISKSGLKLCSYHNQDRKVPGKHGGTKYPVFFGYHEVSKLHLQILWQFSFFT